MKYRIKNGVRIRDAHGLKQGGDQIDLDDESYARLRDLVEPLSEPEPAASAAGVQTPAQTDGANPTGEA